MSQCLFCSSKGIIRVEKSELCDEVIICDKCFKLLKNPTTALPLIRGTLSLQLKIIPKTDLQKAQYQKTLDKFMEEISKWKPRD